MIISFELSKMSEWMNIAKSYRSCQALNKAEPKLSKKSLKSIWLCLKIVYPKIQCLINVAVNHHLPMVTLNILQWLYYIYTYYSNGQNKCHNHWAISYFQSHNKCWQVRTAPLHLELQFDRPHPCPQQPTLPTHAWYVTLWWYLVIVKSHGKWLWIEHIWTLKLTCSGTMNLTRRYGSNPRLPGGEQKINKHTAWVDRRLPLSFLTSQTWPCQPKIDYARGVQATSLCIL